jgi:N-carbamoylputrescine amidase
MRVTVCELPHERDALDAAWRALGEHTRSHASELVLLPELAMVEPLWERERFDAARWRAAETLSHAWVDRFHELGAEHVVATRPVSVGGRRLNQAFLWSAVSGVTPLRSKYFMPEEPGAWEATWFDRGDADFPVFRAGDATIGVNVCTELWALETYATYARLGVELLLAPRATARATTPRWLAGGIVAATRAGAFCLSSNLVDASGAYGGAGWIVDPSGRVSATTSRAEPFATRDVALGDAVVGKHAYPRYALG